MAGKRPIPTATTVQAVWSGSQDPTPHLELDRICRSVKRRGDAARTFAEMFLAKRANNDATPG